MATGTRHAKGGARSTNLNVRMTEATRDKLKADAAERGVSLSEYVRRLCLEACSAGPVLFGDERKELAQLGRRVQQAGVNLNQIARRLNFAAGQAGDAAPETQRLLASDAAVIEEVRESVRATADHLKTLERLAAGRRLRLRRATRHTP